jgi:hypothetical protein
MSAPKHSISSLTTIGDVVSPSLPWYLPPVKDGSQARLFLIAEHAQFVLYLGLISPLVGRRNIGLVTWIA